MPRQPSVVGLSYRAGGVASALHRVTLARMSFDSAAIRREFALFDAHDGATAPAFFDSAGSTLRLRRALECQAHFENHGVCVAATSGATAAQQYAQARERVARFLGAAVDGIVFCRGATEAINLVAQSWGERNVGAGDEIVVTGLEHCANLAPWYALAQRTGARVRALPLDADGTLVSDAGATPFGTRTKLLAITHASNVTGSIPPLAPLIAAAHAAGAVVLVDGAQAVARLPVDVAALGADFYVFSGHKVYGPSGIGVLAARRERLDAMPPWQLGANAIERFVPPEVAYADPPARFEAGSANIAGAVGLAAALDWLDGIGRDAVRAHEAALSAQLFDGLSRIGRVRLLPAVGPRVPIMAFTLDGMDAAALRDALLRRGIALRAGDLAAAPLLEHFGVETALRASIGVYTTSQDVERLCAAVAALAAD